MKSRMEDRGSRIARVSRDRRAPSSILHPLSSIRWRGQVRYIISATLLCCFTGACADNTKEPTTKPLTMQQRQQKALQDPFGYKLTDEDFPSVTGGGTTDLDKKSLKRDVDSFWNP